MKGLCLWFFRWFPSLFFSSLGPWEVLDLHHQVFAARLFRFSLNKVSQMFFLTQCTIRGFDMLLLQGNVKSFILKQEKKYLLDGNHFYYSMHRLRHKYILENKDKQQSQWYWWPNSFLSWKIQSPSAICSVAAQNWMHRKVHRAIIFN